MFHHVSWYNATIFATNWNRQFHLSRSHFSHIFSNPKPEVQNQIHWIAHAAKLHLSGEATNVPGKYFLEDWLSECVVEFKAKISRCFMMFYYICRMVCFYYPVAPRFLYSCLMLMLYYDKPLQIFMFYQPMAPTHLRWPAGLPGSRVNADADG